MRVLRAALPGLVVALALAGCTGTPDGVEPEPGPFVGLAVAGGLPTYNPSTATGAASAAPQVLARVLPGFSYTGPSGGTVSDTDVGTVVQVRPEPLTLRYTFAADAVWSDGTAAGCADLVLARLAHAGTPGFTAAGTTGYADIATVDCAAGDRAATVTFAAGRADPDWRSLFGAGDLLPAHVVAQVSGVADVVAAVAAQDAAAISALGQAWTTGFDLVPGALDPARLPALGPYRVDTLGADGVLTLVPNERWWGDPPGVPRVRVHLDPADPAALLAAGEVQVVDLPTSPELVDALGAAAGTTVTTTTGTAGEQLVLDVRGVLADADLRRALAQCVPRAELAAAATGDSAPGVLDTRLTVPGRVDSPPAPTAVAQDVAAAAATVTALGRAGTAVRIGYRGPDPVRAAAVAAVAAACAPVGFVVTDVSTPQLVPADLGAGGVDVLLAATPASTSPAARGAELRTGVGSGGYGDARVDELLDALAVSTSADERVALCTEAEALLWTQLPTVPLHLQQRTTAVSPAVAGVVPTPAAAGVGWNVDRWVTVG